MEQTFTLVLWVLSFVDFGSCDSNHNITFNAFGDHKLGTIAAFGDFNSDELTDMFVILEDRKALSIFLAYEKEPLLRPSPFLYCHFPWTITSVVPGDFDGDAFMDVMITTKPASINTSNTLDVRILWGGDNFLNCSDANVVKANLIGQPLAIDYNQDMIIDIYGVNRENERMFWIFAHNRSTPSNITFGYEANMKLPHSHSFIDFNGDNAPDLLITTALAVEVWLGNESPGFVLDKTMNFPIGPENPHFGQCLYVDVEISGHFYLLLPVCFDNNCVNSSILIYDDGIWHNLHINFVDPSGMLWRFVPPTVDEIYLETITMRSGDYNMDGYPDLLLTLCPEKSNETQTFLLHNQPCRDGDEKCAFRRTYLVQWSHFLPFSKSTVLAVFYDFYSDGTLDVIFLEKNKTSNEYSFKAYKNNLDVDTNFIKIIVLTGLKNKRVPEMVGILGKKKGTYGTNLPGPRIAYSTIAQDGTERRGVCAQLPQSAYYALYLPYSIFGLDRTPNFVDSLVVGMSKRMKTWTQIIPNSQLVVIPYPLDMESQWRAQLFVTPSKLVLKSVFILTGILVTIGTIIAFLHLKEQKEDRLAAFNSNDDSSVAI